jgi:hypothetical protein
MSTFGPEAWNHLDRVPSMSREQVKQLLEYLLGLACKAQNEANIALGRRSLVRIPREWLLQNLPDTARDFLDLDDEWEFRRYVELCSFLDASFAEAVVEQGRSSRDAMVREAAEDSGRCDEFARTHAESVGRPPL